MASNAKVPKHSSASKSDKMPLKRKHMSSHQTPLSDLSNSEPNMKRVRRSSCASERLMPDILNASTEFGSPHKFWTSLCEKDEAYFRNPNYMDQYSQLLPHMRRTLFNWLMDVCEDLTLHRETFHLAVDFIDRLFSKGGIDVRPNNLQLIGVSSLLLATKIEEVYPPKLAEFVSLTAGACTEDEVRKMEEIILSKLEWHCSPVTSIQWLAFYLHLISRQELEPFCSLAPSDSFPSSCTDSAAIKAKLSSSVLNTSTNSDSQYASEDHCRSSVEFNSSLGQSFILNNHSQMRHLGQFSIPKLMRDDFIMLTRVIELCIFDMEYLEFTYSQIAAAVVMLSYDPRDQVESITGFCYNDIVDAINYVEPIVKAARAKVIPGVIIPHFSNVEPRDFHNIQTGFSSDHEKLLEEIENLRAERKRLVDAKKSSRTKILF